MFTSVLARAYNMSNNLLTFDQGYSKLKMLVPHFTYYFNITILVIELLFYYFVYTNYYHDGGRCDLPYSDFFLNIKFHIAMNNNCTFNFNIML